MRIDRTLNPQLDQGCKAFQLKEFFAKTLVAVPLI